MIPRRLGMALLLGLPGMLAAQAAAPPGNPDGPAITLTSYTEAGPPEHSLDVLFVGEGYAGAAGQRKFKKDLERYGKRLLETAPFSWYRKRIAIRGAHVQSKDDGCDASDDEDEVQTPLNASFNTRDGRSLTFRDDAALARVVATAGNVDIAFVMVNTERYGGGGTVLYSVLVRGRPLPAPTFAAQDTTSFLIALHELGHSFADLSDEYEEKSKDKSFPLPDEGDIPSANATLPKLVDRTSFAGLKRTLKWKHFLDLKGARDCEWVHEGGYYREKGVLRPWDVCLMRSLDQEFCPVCAEEMSRAILVACGETWDDAAFHQAHPLSLWQGKH